MGSDNARASRPLLIVGRSMLTTLPACKVWVFNDNHKGSFMRGAFVSGFFVIGILLSYHSAAEPPSVAEVPEIRPGLLMGYLPMDNPLRSDEFIPPPPAAGSAEQAADEAFSARLLANQDTARFDLARADARLGPDSTATFSCAVGINISQEDTPHLQMLLRRTLTDLGLASYGAKNAYQRERPFMSNQQPICTPEEEEMLRGDGSYPSGHTAIGWGWALILSDLVPDRAEQILARGIAFGDSRNVCNVHWRSDVQAGILVGSAAFARLQSNADFLEARALARSEITKAKANSEDPKGDCEAEKQALQR